jgi:tRNA pseudouridine55 synthase
VNVATEQLRDGLAVVDKEAGWTSHDVVAKARGILHNKRIGHSGTLDPDATGVLLLGVGRVTRLLRYLTALPKSYVGELVLGVETSTLDAAGEVTSRHDMSSVHAAEVAEAALGFTGEITQVPPMVSAVRVGGRRLHELARAGVEVERAPRPVTVHRFDVSSQPGDPPDVYSFGVECSSGTYVRSLVADLGRALGGGAHVRTLRRTAVGSFTQQDARPLGDIVVRPPVDAMRDYEQVVVDERTATDIGHGRVLPVDRLAAVGGGPWAVVDQEHTLLAVYEQYDAGRVKPAVVIAPAVPGSFRDDAQR